MLLCRVWISANTCPAPPTQLGCSRNALLSLQAVSAQPAAVVSLGLYSKPWVPACLYQRMWISGWSLQGTGISPLCMVLSVLPVADWLLGSPWSLKLSFCPGAWSPCQQGGFLSAGTFPLFRLPGVQVPSHVLFSSFYPAQSQEDLPCPFIGLRSASVQ